MTKDSDNLVLKRKILWLYSAKFGNKWWCYNNTSSQRLDEIYSDFLKRNAVTLTKMPHEVTLTKMPHEVTLTKMPHEGTLTKMPHEVTLTKMPHEVTLTKMPHEVTLTKMPHEVTLTKMPHEVTLTKMPHEDTLTKMPHEDTLTKMPHGDTLAKMPHEVASKSNNIINNDNLQVTKTNFDYVYYDDYSDDRDNNKENETEILNYILDIDYNKFYIDFEHWQQINCNNNLGKRHIRRIEIPKIISTNNYKDDLVNYLINTQHVKGIAGT